MNHKVVVQTHHKTTCSSSIRVSTNLAETMSLIEPIVEQNHLLNKRIMHNLLSSEICKRMKLELKNEA